jgi:hypothetical protein
MAIINPVERPKPALIMDANGVNTADVVNNALNVNISSGQGVNNSVPVTVVSDGSVVDPNNSTTTLLAAPGATFTGSKWFDALNYSQVTVVARSDQSSAIGGMQIQYSTDGVNIDHIVSTTATANESASVQSGIHGRYVRIVYINGDTPQASFFRLQTLFNCISGTGTIRDLDTLVEGDDNAQVTRSVLTGRILGGSVFTDVITDVYGSLQTVVGGQAADAFGRVRTANPTTIFDAQFNYDAQPLLFTSATVGTGSFAKTTGESSVTLTTGGTGNSAAATFQSRQYFRYEPGKSQQIMMTGFLGAQKTNVRSDIGYFDDNNGVFFRMDGWAPGTTSNSQQGMCVVQRSDVSGSVVDTVVPQSSWNFDKMDGTGPSGITLNFADTQVFVIDFQWLGTGRVRYGFFVNGTLLICHQIYNANVITVPYTNTANLPVRYKIANAPSGVIASTTTMKAICMTVISEGGVDRPATFAFSITSGTSGITAGNGTLTPIISIQPKLTFNSLVNRAFIFPTGIALSNTNSGVMWQFLYNATLGGGSTSFSSAGSSTAVNFDIGSTTVSGGILVAAGYNGNAGANKVTLESVIASKFPFTLDINGANPDTYTFAVVGLGNTAPCWAEIDWTEIR